MERGLHASLKPRRQKSYASLGSEGGKPCPTCYAPMTYWTLMKTYLCAKHGEPNRD